MLRLLVAVASTCIVLPACSPPQSTATPVIYGVQLAKSRPGSQQPHLLLPLEVDIESASEFVRNGYGDEFSRKFSSYSFRTQELRTNQVQQLVRLIKSYRSFNGEAVAQAITTFEGRVTSMQFGRELSPVLYVQLPHWTHQREMSPKDAERRRIPDDENAKLVAELRRRFVEELQASEFGPERGDPRRIRVWWH